MRIAIKYDQAKQFQNIKNETGNQEYLGKELFVVRFYNTFILFLLPLVTANYFQNVYLKNLPIIKISINISPNFPQFFRNLEIFLKSPIKWVGLIAIGNYTV